MISDYMSTFTVLGKYNRKYIASVGLMSDMDVVKIKITSPDGRISVFDKLVPAQKYCQNEGISQNGVNRIEKEARYEFRALRKKGRNIEANVNTFYGGGGFQFGKHDEI
jgi:hypothetical protein